MSSRTGRDAAGSTPRRSLRIADGTWEAMKAAAAGEGMNLTAWVLGLVKGELDRKREG